MSIGSLLSALDILVFQDDCPGTRNGTYILPNRHEDPAARLSPLGKLFLRLGW